MVNNTRNLEWKNTDNLELYTDSTFYHEKEKKLYYGHKKMILNLEKYLGDKPGYYASCWEILSSRDKGVWASICWWYKIVSIYD